MNIITCQRGSMGGIWFQSQADYDAVRAHPDMQAIGAMDGRTLLPGSAFGFPLRVATPEQWATLAALLKHEVQGGDGAVG